MNFPLQAHYLDIEWQEPGRAREIRVAPEPIEIEEKEDGTLMAETQVFHDLSPWVGLRLEGELADAEPTFEGSDGRLAPMLRIKDCQGGHWWIQNDGWDAIGKRHLSELHRSMGQFTIVIGARRLLFNNVVDELSRVAVEDYLRDFQQDLIWLVMGFGGASAATGGGLTANQEMVEALEAFSSVSRRVLDNPARHVREIQIESRPARLRPNMATFRKYLRNPAAQQLPGRGADQTPDIAENRYLRHMVQVCETLASHIAKSAVRHAMTFADRARVEAERGTEYQNMTHRKVDLEIFDRQLAELRQKLERVEAYRDANRHPGENGRKLEFRAEGPYGKSLDRIFFKNKDGSKAAGEREGRKYDFSVLRIPEVLVEAIQATKSFCDYFLLRGVGSEKWRETEKGKPFREVHFTAVYSAKPFTNAISRKEAKRAQLENNDWLAPLTVKERQENSQEARTARLREQTYRHWAQQAEQASSALSRCQAELRAQDLAWQKLGVTSSAEVPMGVRFSQSPDYTACRMAFLRITAFTQKSGLSIDTLDAIERIGVLHASALYERWCLVKIISILMEDYRFQPEPGWQERLVRGIAGKPQSLDLEFRREDVGMLARLEVQPELPNGRRPDFRLRFSYDDVGSSSDREDDDQWDGPPHNARTQGSTADGLIMDAKFRTHWRRGELGRMLTSLIDEKRYDGEGDRVFILHPAPRAMLRPTSPLPWGKDCDYGQETGNKHRKGVIYLAPGAGGLNPEGNLRRLIVMLLQATFPEPVQEETERYGVWKSNSFCIRCGKEHQPEDIQQHFTQRGRMSWRLSCSECGMQSTRTHCFGCNSSILFKNGLDLTYHRTVADQVTNIVCPQCGKYFDNDVSDRQNSPHVQDSGTYEEWSAGASSSQSAVGWNGN